MNDVSFGLLTEQYFYSKSLRPATEWSYQKVVRSFEGFTSFNPTKIDHLTVMKWRHTVLNDTELCDPDVEQQSCAYEGAV